MMSCSIAKRGRGRSKKASIKTDVCTDTTSLKFRVKIKTLGQQKYYEHVISPTIPKKPRTKGTRILNRKQSSWGQRSLLDHNPKPNPISHKEAEGVSHFHDLDPDQVNTTRSSLLSSCVDKPKPTSSENEVERVLAGFSSPRLKISLSTPLSEYIIPGPIPNNIDELAWDEDMNLHFWKDIPNFEE
nr:hypothetical protein Itr_chr11CG24780 [Ipomoea trifida]